jgi:hypothetical protein
MAQGVDLYRDASYHTILSLLNSIIRTFHAAYFLPSWAAARDTSSLAQWSVLYQATPNTSFQDLPYCRVTSPFIVMDQPEVENHQPGFVLPQLFKAHAP